MNQDTRRAIRTTVHVIGSIAMLVMLGWIVYIMPTTQLRLVAMGLIAILFVREMMHGAENVTARVKFSASATGGVSGEVDPGTAAQQVADEAQDEAEKFK